MTKRETREKRTPCDVTQDVVELFSNYKNPKSSHYPTKQKKITLVSAAIAHGGGSSINTSIATLALALRSPLWINT